jgi:hypothetical protein
MVVKKLTYTFLPLGLNTPLWRPKKIFMPPWVETLAPPLTIPCGHCFAVN